MAFVDIIDPAVLRPGRLCKTLYVGLPTPQDRHDILKAITKVRKTDLVFFWHTDTMVSDYYNKILQNGNTVLIIFQYPCLHS